jgi:predicted nucleic acid-binding protein
MILTPDNEYAAVLDACALVPMPLCDTLLRLAEEPAMYRPMWSSEILREVENALQSKLNLSSEQASRRIRVMRQAFPEAMVECPEGFSEGIRGVHPKDRHVVAAAILGHANAIVTLNQKDFPQESLSPFGILLHTPNSFLVHQFHLNSDLVLEKLDAQAAARHVERRVVAESLRRVAAEFADLVLSRL